MVMYRVFFGTGQAPVSESEGMEEEKAPGHGGGGQSLHFCMRMLASILHVGECQILCKDLREGRGGRVLERGVKGCCTCRVTHVYSFVC